MKKKFNLTYFRDDDITTLTKDLPLKLIELESIIETIANKYPTLSKPEIASIIKALCEEMRSQLLQGNTIHIKKYLHSMRLYSYIRIRTEKLTLTTKIQVKTPKIIRFHAK